MRKEEKTGKNLKNIKAENGRSVLYTLRQKDTMSIKQIADHIGLSNTSVSKIINNLIEKGMVIDCGKGDSTEEGGKRPTLFSINSTYRYGLIILVELDGIYGYIYDLSLKQRDMLARKQLIHSYQECVTCIDTVICDLIHKWKLTEANLCGIMIGFPGIVSFDEGMIIYPICSPEWGENLHLKDDIRQKLGLDVPVGVENSGRLIGYSELIHLENAVSETIVVLGHDSRDEYRLLNGAGGSVIINGQLMHGKGNVGEFGHMTVDVNDKVQCRCGRYGCFESATSVLRLLNRAEKELPQHPDSILAGIHPQELTPEKIFDAANQGDPFGRELLDPVINYFTVMLNNIIISYDPDKICIFGIYSKAGDYFISSIRGKIDQYFPYRKIQITYSTDNYLEKEQSGAALLLVENFLSQDSLYI